MNKMTQNSLDIAQKLEFVPENCKTNREDAVAAMAESRVVARRNKLPLARVDDLEILTCAWPGSTAGSILLTARDFTAGFGRAAAGLAIQPFDDTAGGDAFLRLPGQSNTSRSNIDLAKQIAHNLGRLLLVIRQISGFVVQQRLAPKGFLPLYERNAVRIHNEVDWTSDYRHTLSIMWDLALSSLTKPCKLLQKLLAFFDLDPLSVEVII